LKKFLILFFLIFVNFLKAEIGWKEDSYILNLVISKKGGQNEKSKNFDNFIFDNFIFTFI